MKYMRNNINMRLCKTAVTLGKFDGFHLGHKKLMEELKNSSSHLQTVLFTFSTPPGKMINGEWREILSPEERRLKYKELCPDVVVEYPFSKEVMETSPEDFIRQVLIRKLDAKKIIVGRDYHFGYQRKGNVELLKKLADKWNYELKVFDKVLYENEEISSTRIKRCIEAGQIRKANAMLGYPYFVYGEIVHGNRLGRTIGLPTINQLVPEGKLLPPNGVYASAVTIEGNRYYGITNVGCKPTVKSDSSLTVETFLFDFDREVYGKQAQVELYQFLREEKGFSGMEQLKSQIQSDIAEIRKNFREIYN